MTWTLNAAAFAATDLEDRQPGQLLVSTDQHVADLPLMLVLAEPAGNLMLVDMGGQHAFRVRIGRAGAPGDAFVLTLSNGGYEIELPKELRSAGDQSDTPGALAITPEGAFLVVTWRVQGFDEAAYVSLRDWTLHRQRPGRPMTTFGTWRLNLAPAPGAPRKTIIERGQWPDG